MEKATDGLNRTNRSIQSSAEIINILGHRADDIGKIIEVIDDLAEQTNLLALNAAIEAARAGEHGLGFAVVADEVRKLAEKSTQSTKEIADLIQSIQREARQAVENMEHSTRIVEEGLSFGNDLGTALHKISDVVTEVYKFSQEIGAATNEQSVGSSQIAKATNRLTEITQEIILPSKNKLLAPKPLCAPWTKCANSFNNPPPVPPNFPPPLNRCSSSPATLWRTWINSSSTAPVRFAIDAILSALGVLLPTKQMNLNTLK